MANFIEIKTATSRMFVNLDCVDAIFPSKKANETVLSFVGSEEYVTAIESYDAIIERILCSPNCSELKPCPFCGAGLVKDDFGNGAPANGNLGESNGIYGRNILTVYG